MKLLQKSSLTGIDWWDANRKELNRAIESYNKMLLDICYKQNAYMQIGLAYASIDTKNTDYSQDFVVMIDKLQSMGFDTSFYKGFGGE